LYIGHKNKNRSRKEEKKGQVFVMFSTTEFVSCDWCVFPNTFNGDDLSGEAHYLYVI
jgi:hypothetical protein